ncbi:hypothetical protein L4D77_24275 [Photobacterium frigidiphilum]|uniref:hypothetical protein n=1 Tax=Photobacterium frigidiphilum TaxID=264736 RepID=UPI003D0CB438
MTNKKEVIRHKKTDQLDHGHFVDIKTTPDQYTTDAAANKIHFLMGGNVEMDDIRMIVSFIKDYQVPYIMFTK